MNREELIRLVLAIAGAAGGIIGSLKLYAYCAGEPFCPLGKYAPLLWLPAIGMAAGHTLYRVQNLPCGVLWGYALAEGSFLVGVCMDAVWEEVGVCIWWVGFAGAAAPFFFLLWQQPIERGALILSELTVFFVLQEGIMAKTYGRADAHAFCLCGMLFVSSGCGWEACTVQMISSFFLLVTVQLIRKNVRNIFRLKEPVALLPYIWIGYLLTPAGNF